MSDVHYCDREQMNLVKALELRKKFLACDENFDKCAGDCVRCEHNFKMSEYHKAENYVWSIVEKMVQPVVEVMTRPFD